MLERKEFGFFNGYKVWLFTITNKNGASVTLTNFAQPQNTTSQQRMYLGTKFKI